MQSTSRARLALAMLALIAPAAHPQAVAATPVLLLQESEPAPEGAADPGPPDEEVAAELDARLSELDAARTEIDALAQRREGTEGLEAEILGQRSQKAWLRLLEGRLEFVSEVRDLAEAGVDVSEFRDEAEEALRGQLALGQEAMGLVADAIELPEDDLSAVDRSQADMRLFESLDLLDGIQDVLVSSLAVADDLGVELAELEAWLRLDLAERARNISIFLEMATREVEIVKGALQVAPDDAELARRLVVSQKRVKRVAEELSRIAARMKRFDLETGTYKEQILAATGEITTDVLRVEVLGALVAGWSEKVMAVVVENGPGLLFKFIVFLLILFAFRKLAKVAARLVERGLGSARLRMSNLLRQMITGMVGKAVMLLGVLIALSQLGISLGPLLAGLGIAGFVIGFALQDTLSNFASGLMILFYRPFDVGDVIEAGDAFGKVSRMSLVNTTILTFDNQTLILPNNMIWQNVIKNVTGQKRRRVDLTFGVSYEDDIPKVEELLVEIVKAHDKVLDDPKPQIKLHELADSSVNFVVRPWVRTEDYWDVYWDLMRAVKIRFDEEGISIPFPQRDVHLYPTSADARVPDQIPAAPPGGPAEPAAPVEGAGRR